MANTSRTGFWPVGTLSGSPWQGSVKKFYHGIGEASAVYLGDMVCQVESGNANVAIAGEINIVGSMVGREALTKTPSVGTLSLDGNTAVDLSRKYINSGENTAMYVCTAPDAIYECQASNGTPTQALVGACVDLVASAGSATTGISGYVVDVGNPLDTTAQLKVVGLVDRADNEGAANAKILVVVNEHFYKSTTGAA